MTQSAGQLSVGRLALAGTAAGDLALFAGGAPGIASPALSTVDVYDSRTAQWSTAALSAPRENIGATSSAAKAFFAGGDAPTSQVPLSNTVDIFDAASGEWSTSRLSQARTAVTATSVAGRAIFAGGQSQEVSGEDNSGVVDIYDTSSAEWTTAALSQARYDIAAASVGHLAIFAGGRVDRAGGSEGLSPAIDVYDADTGEWYSTNLPSGAVLSDFVIGADAVFFGNTGSTTVQYIYDSVTNRWSSSDLPMALEGATVALGNHILFFEGNLVGTYDWPTGELETEPLTVPAADGPFVIVGNQAITAGGEGAGFEGINTADIFTDTAPAAEFDGDVIGRARGRSTVILSNTGDADFTGPYTVQVYAIPPRQYYGAILLGSQAVSTNLATGDSLRFSIPINTTNIPAGTYHLVAMVKAADGTLTPFAGATENFTIGKSASAKPAAAFQPKLAAAPMSATFVPNLWLSDSASILE